MIFRNACAVSSAKHLAQFSRVQQATNARNSRPEIITRSFIAVSACKVPHNAGIDLLHLCSQTASNLPNCRTGRSTLRRMQVQEVPIEKETCDCNLPLVRISDLRAELD
jgi:hypothetical protein